jgi:hypothetical protein
MKNFLICILTLALTAAAFLTRPGKRDFVLYWLDARNAANGRADFDEAERQARGVTYKDRYLWTDVEKDGKVVYSGAFGHWIPRGETAEKPLPRATELARLLGH